MRSAQQEALQEIAAEIDDGGQLLFRLNAFRHHGRTELPAQRRDRSNELLANRRPVDALHERTIELDKIWFERGEAVQTGVSGAEVVESNAVPESSQRARSTPQVVQSIERRALCNLQYHGRRLERQ